MALCGLNTSDNSALAPFLCLPRADNIQARLPLPRFVRMKASLLSVARACEIEGKSVNWTSPRRSKKPHDEYITRQMENYAKM